MITTKKMAVELGMTHEGTLFGVPAWFKVKTEDDFDAAPKFWLAWIWIFICDKLYEAATWFMSEDSYIETPVKINREIKP